MKNTKDNFIKTLTNFGYIKNGFGHYIKKSKDGKQARRWRMKNNIVYFEGKMIQPNSQWVKLHVDTLYMKNFHLNKDNKISFEKNGNWT